MKVLTRLSFATFLTLNACSATTGTQSLAVADTDQDSVPDELDQCDQTRMPQPVNEAGCAVFHGALSNVDFAANSADLSRASRLSLDELVMQLNAYPGVMVTVDGHTDNRGSGIRNLALSKERVLAVVRYLVARGVNPRQLRPFAYGESRPTVSNASAEGRRQNRRIEVSVLFPTQDAAAPAIEPKNEEPWIEERQTEQLVESGASDN